MAIIFFDGFENRTDSSYINSKWDQGSAPNWYTTAGRRNGGRVHFNDDSDCLIKFIPAYNTYILGVAMYHHGDISNDDVFIHFLDGNTDQIELQCKNYGSGVADLQILRGSSTALATTTTKPIKTDTWQYLEIKVVIDDTAGSVEVRLDGETILNVSGVDTDHTGSGTVNVLYLSGLASDVSFDDFYLLDDTGSKNNDFLGDVKVVSLMPTGDGSYSEMTPLAGLNYENIDGVLDFATYNTADSVNDADTYTLTLPTAVPTIHGIQISSVAKNADVGYRKIKHMLYKNTTAYLGGNELQLSDSELGFYTVWESDPVDSMTWNKDKLNVTQFGIKLIQ